MHSFSSVGCTRGDAWPRLCKCSAQSDSGFLFLRMLFADRVSRSLLILCLTTRQSVLRGNAFNYKRKRANTPPRFSSFDDDDSNDNGDAIISIFLSYCECESATMYIVCCFLIALAKNRDRAVLSAINVLLAQIYLGATFCTQIGKVKAARSIIRFLLATNSLND